VSTTEPASSKHLHQLQQPAADERTADCRQSGSKTFLLDEIT